MIKVTLYYSGSPFRYILKNEKLLDASKGYYFIILNNNTNICTNKLNELY